MMRLYSLRLENFQGVLRAQFDFYGGDADIFGDNATGKSTLYNAYTWVLFDKASTGVKNFSPKTTGPTGELHHLNHTAEVVLQLDDSRLLTLKKDLHEVYKKKRGSLEEQYDGNTVDYFIDGVPAKEKEYQALVNDLLGNDPERGKVLSMPNYFPSMMSWDARRTLLLEMCGSVSDREIIASNEGLRDLEAFLRMPGTADQMYTVEEYRKIAAACRAQINNELLGLPGRIDEAQRAIPDTAKLDKAGLAAQINAKRAQQSQQQSAKAAALESLQEGSGVRIQIAEAKTQLAEAHSTHAMQAASLNESANLLVSKAQTQRQQHHTASESSHQLAESLNLQITSLETRRKLLLDTYSEVQSKQFDEDALTCPTCNQYLPSDRAEALRAEFNTKKSIQLEEINRQGQNEASQQMIDELKAKHATASHDATDAAKQDSHYAAEVDKYRAQLQTPAPFESTLQYQQIMARITDLQENDINSSAAQEGLRKQHDSILAATVAEIMALEQQMSSLRFAATQNKRIAELQVREQELAREFEQTERGIYLCDQFTKCKVEALDERINRNFTSVRFRLFQQQINGGLKDDCEVLVPTVDGHMVPYAFANNAAQINAGLEIIEAVSSHWGISMPVFVDNAESITRLQRINAQVIRLVVSEQDPSMRLELLQSMATA